jgi:hypothetical protein
VHVGVEAAAVGVAERPALAAAERDPAVAVRALDRHADPAVVRLGLVHLGILEVDHHVRLALRGRHDAEAAGLTVVGPAPRDGDHDKRQRDREEHRQGDQPGT